MIRVAAVYPRLTGKKFDMDYYLHAHLPMVARKFAPFGLKKIEVDRGVEKPGGGNPPFFAIGYLYFDSLDDFQKCYNAVGAEVVGNIRLYTDVAPMIQVGIVEQLHENREN
ncbi:MAG: EthD family reductase [Candidatus Omnitrophica bacterium]|nr:EthD family reductase [Candidatus Omnitrophota bacterium]MDE2009685.1 EthD family reductase [Candidatus Omnitrophota bacterium]MDE2213918.1 EthD family reductase [Candidatus Omnitrophota bacterium]MDE2231932.1 EthD family reductase [Candidatus Omnitrophota bacterium]